LSAKIDGVSVLALFADVMGGERAGSRARESCKRILDAA